MARAGILERFDPAFLKGRTVLVTGGTGSFGKGFVRAALGTAAAKIIVFSRDELKQSEMQAEFAGADDDRLRFFLGDIRDRHRLRRAVEGVDFIVHAAALKQVPTLEYNPSEAVRTNIEGTQNVIDAAIDAGVERVIGISTDKAVSPINLYGATKLCSEKLLVAGNAYAGGRKTRISVVRYGNVAGSRGSVVPLFLAKKREGVIPVTDERMTRFWITLDQGVNFVLNGLRLMSGGELFIPKIPSMKVVDLAKAIAPECRIKIVGERPGEKIHEALISQEEARRARDFGDYFVVSSDFRWLKNGKLEGKALPAGFKLTSDANDLWLSSAQLKAVLSA